MNSVPEILDILLKQQEKNSKQIKNVRLVLKHFNAIYLPE